MLLAVLLDWSQPIKAASTIQFSATTYTVAEDANSVNLSVLRTNDTATAVSVDYSSSDGTATNSLKYASVAGTLVFDSGETNKDIVVPILTDGLVQGATQFTVFLTNPTGGAVLGSSQQATVQIQDNDVGVAFEFAQYWVREDEGSVLIGVVRGDNGDFSMSVDVSTANGTAVAGVDYTGVTNTMSFAAGEKIKLLTIPIFNDGLRNGDRSFRLTLSNPSGGVALGATTTATVTILDNDPGVQFVANQLWVHETEGAVQLTVTRGNDLLMDAFTVDYATSNGTALAGIRYAAAKGTLAFAAGETTKTFQVSILRPASATRDSQFKLILSNPTGGMLLGRATNVIATVTVCDTREMLPHSFGKLFISAQGVVTGSLAGGYTSGLGLVNRFQPFFDVYPVEVSSNLIDWTVLTWSVRTNALAGPITFVDSNAPGFSGRFYRVPSQGYIAPQQPPSGPFGVGRIYRIINDTSRRNRYHVSTNGAFPITIWYPAQREAGQWPASYEPEAETRDPREWGNFVDRAPYYSSYSIQDAPFGRGLTQLPVILWSHGYPDYRFDGEELAEQLASHGYVVVGIDHSDCPVPVFPDGRYLYTDPDVAYNNWSLATLENRARDLMVTLDELTKWNDQDPFFVGKLNVQNTAGIGWSYGGGTVGEFCRVDSRGKAAVILEGYLQNADNILTSGLTKPVLSMYASNGGDTDLFIKLKKDAIYFQIANTEHASFSKWYWTLTAETLAQGRQAANIISDYTLWFLDKYLKGSTNAMPSQTNYPRIYNFQKK
jgi:dienelactone hydrolase